MHQFGDSVTSALGVRGIRLSLARTELLEVQLRAMLRASAFGPVRILLPMVTSVSEVRAAREILPAPRAASTSVASSFPPRCHQSER